jgi:hypothetical protein
MPPPSSCPPPCPLLRAKQSSARPCQGHHTTPAKETVPVERVCGVGAHGRSPAPVAGFTSAPTCAPRTPVLQIHSERCVFQRLAPRSARNRTVSVALCVGENPNAAGERERGTDLIRGNRLFARYRLRQSFICSGKTQSLENSWPPAVAAESPLPWTNARISMAWRTMLQRLKGSRENIQHENYARISMA